MNKSTAAVAAGTLVALMAASLWVPTSVWWGSSGSGPRWMGVWHAEPEVWPVPEDHRPHHHVMWRLLALELVIIVAAGGLLAVFLRTRSARGVE